MSRVVTRRAFVLGGSAAMVTLAGSGCASPTSSPTTPGSSATGVALTENPKLAEYYALAGAERRDALLKALKEEGGQLDLYTSMTSTLANKVSKAFGDQFDLDVNLYRADGETVRQRLLQEAKAGYQGCDFVETDASELYPIAREGLLSSDYTSEFRDALDKAAQFDGWSATRLNLFTVSWNTQMVSPEEAPKRWEDLADPKWNGQLAMELGDFDWYLTLNRHWVKQGKSQEEVDKLFTDMASGAQVVKGHTVMGELLSAGQFKVAASNYSYLVQQAMDKGAPLDYRPMVEPIIFRPNGGGIVKTAKHPAAATLFIDWLLGEDGQKVLADTGVTPSNPPAGVRNDLQGHEAISVDLEEMATNSAKWSTEYADLMAKGTATKK